MDVNSELNCCRLCFLANDKHISVFENTDSGLNIARTLEKHFEDEVIESRTILDDLKFN